MTVYRSKINFWYEESNGSYEVLIKVHKGQLFMVENKTHLPHSWAMEEDFSDFYEEIKL